jgi:LysR family transcriptional regulator, glycine cleavage system transcriptional activator
MPRLYPSTQELLSFVCVARHSSITAAANELSLTQGAVSKAIQNLEDVLGVKLFERVKQRVVITAAGEIYLRKAQDVIHSLEESTLEMRSFYSTKSAIKISTVPTFGAQWLLPRLPKFQKAHPDIAVSFAPYSVNDGIGTADIFIKYGEGLWPNLNATYLTGKELVVLVGVKTAKSVRNKSHLAKIPLIHHASLPHAWRDWNDSFGKLKTFTPYAGERFDQFSLIIEAVKADLGAALLPRCLVQREIANGQTIELFGNTISSWKGYYLCTEQRRTPSPQLLTFMGWLESKRHEHKRD